MTESAKIRLLNTLLAVNSPHAGDLYVGASLGIERAMLELDEADLNRFAKNMIKFYDPSAEVELLEFGASGYFDPLFALPLISSAVRRLSGFKRAVLIVDGMDKTLSWGGKKTSPKRREAYAYNMDLIEDYVLRYKNAFPNLEILFI